MKAINIGLILLMCSTACHQEQKKQDATAEKSDTAKIDQQLSDRVSYAHGKNNYRYLKNGDTISLAITIEGDKVHGDLLYAWKEKDRNSGHIDGVLKGDVLLADYTFSSEGQESVRQVVFKLSKDHALEGYGTMEEKAGKMSFVDPQKVTYDGKFPLEKVNAGD
jgi:hypothetical protein